MKKTIRLTESDIRRMVMEAMNELDWKTYANAAKKSKERGDRERNYRFRDKTWRQFNKDWELYTC
ncbi:MAG: hypothetical protein K6A67_05930 [Bacteroidales bacterium]|nr:hypothetical protein [Bacteroidales bacterium]